ASASRRSSSCKTTSCFQLATSLRRSSIASGFCAAGSTSPRPPGCSTPLSEWSSSSAPTGSPRDWASEASSDASRCQERTHRGRTVVPDPWQSVATPYGGTVSCLASVAKPRLVFAATPVGVFRSTDGGSHWVSTGGALTVPLASAVALSPGFAHDRTLF